MPSMEDYRKQFERERQEKMAASEEALGSAMLKSDLPNKIIVTYNGSGDSGSIEDMEFEGGGEIPNGALKDAIAEYVYDHLPSGWEINEGSRGTMTFDLTKGLVEHEHYERIETEELHESTYKLPKNALLKRRVV